MSYILKIWERPERDQLPADVASLEASIEALEQGAPRPSVHFVRLIQQLTSRYPDITSVAAQAVPESDWAWSSGPLTGTTDTVLVLGLRTEKIDEVRPFVIQQAAALALAVLDPQAGTAWLPGGVHIGAPLAEPTRPVVPEAGALPSRSEAAFLVFDAIAPLLAAAGFKPSRSKRLFKRPLVGGWQEIVLMVRDEGAGYAFSSLCRIRIDMVAELHAKVFLQDMAEKERQALPTVILRQGTGASARNPSVPPSTS